MNLLERRAIGGESPVVEISASPREFLSSTGHVKPGVNMGGPPSKPKYSVSTDSELVP